MLSEPMLWVLITPGQGQRLCPRVSGLDEAGPATLSQVNGRLIGLLFLIRCGPISRVVPAVQMKMGPP